MSFVIQVRRRRWATRRMILQRWLVGPNDLLADRNAPACELLCDGTLVQVPIGFDGWVGQRLVEVGEPVPLDGTLAVASGSYQGARMPDGFENTSSFSAADMRREGRLPPFDVFVSYRRRDAELAADTVVRRLNINDTPSFLAPGGITLGFDYMECIHDALNRAKVMILVIGDQWLTQNDEHGKRRIDSAGDWVRTEVQAAIDRRIPIIPLMFEGAQLPPEAQLPPSIASLARAQGYFVRTESLDTDLDTALEGLLRHL